MTPFLTRSARAVAAIVLALGLAGPATAAAPPLDVPETVAAMNRDGFAAFAAVGGDFLDVGVSPLLRWYVHRFLTLRSSDAAARSLIAQLRSSGVSIETTMHVARAQSDYTDAIAARERDDLGAQTLWDLNAAGQYAWTLNVKMRARNSLATQPFAKVPAQDASVFARDGVRGVRLDAVDASRSVFLFWGTRTVLTDIRRQMSPELWRRLSAGFTAMDVDLPDLVLNQRASNDFPIDAPERFGSPVSASYHYRSGAFEVLGMSASTAELSLDLAAAVKGLSTVSRLLDPKNPNGLRTIGAPTSHYLLSPPIPEERRFSIVAPLLYVVQDMRTGAILFMGEHV